MLSPSDLGTALTRIKGFGRVVGRKNLMVFTEWLQSAPGDLPRCAPSM